MFYDVVPPPPPGWLFCLETNSTPSAEATSPWNGPSHRFDRRITSTALSGSGAAIGWMRVVSRRGTKYSDESQRDIWKKTLRTTEAEKIGSRAVYPRTVIIIPRVGMIITVLGY